METYEIYNLDCSVKNNRKRLLKETMEAIKEEEKPDKVTLKRYCKHLGKKHKFKFQLVKPINDKIFISVLTPHDGYVTFYVNSNYEALCKFILLIKAYVKYRKLKVK